MQVFGTAPRIDVIQDFDLLNGDVPGSAPSHRQMIDFWTPKAFSSPVMPFSAMAVWAAQQNLEEEQEGRVRRSHRPVPRPAHAGRERGGAAVYAVRA